MMFRARCKGLLLVLVVASGLSLAEPAVAQTAGVLMTPRVGGGLTITQMSGIGVTGGILYPIRDYGGIRSLGILGAIQFVNFDGWSQLSFGGGVRWTRLLENVMPDKNFRIYGQGVYGVSRVLEEFFPTTDHGFTVGGGAGFAITPRLDAFAEVNVARITSPEFDFSYSGLVMLFGVSAPLGGN
jgi:hypothetical protein